MTRRPPPAEDAQLAGRVSAFHLRQRLGLEDDHEARIFGGGAGVFHVENWLSFHAFVRLVLRLTLMYRRGQRNALAIEVVENSVPIAGLAAALDGFTMLQLSDLHLDMHEQMPHVLAERVRDLEHDVAVITGDIRARTFGHWDEALDGLERVRAQLGETVYAILGNHDSLRMVPRIEAMGITALLNESAVVERSGERLYLAGIDDPHYFGVDNMEKAAAGIPPGAPAILLAHSPEVYRQAAHAGFALMLCGHTHGGQICLPGGAPIVINARCPRRFGAGAWSWSGLAGYTSRGSGASLVDARFNCPPEVTVHRLSAAPVGGPAEPSGLA